MRTPHRLAYAALAFVLAGYVGGCADDDGGGEGSNGTGVTQPTVVAGVSGGPTSGVPTSAVGAGGVVRGVSDGSPCSPQGARGITGDGLPLLCSGLGGETRWRPA